MKLLATLAVLLSSVCRFVVEVLSRGNPTIATILTTQSLDREDVGVYQLPLLSTDIGSPPQSSVTTVTVSLRDVNDNSPLFSQPSFTFNLNENTNNTLIMDFNVSMQLTM